MTTRTITVEALVSIVGKALYGWGDDEPNGATGFTARYEVEQVAAAIFAALPAEPAAPEPTAEELIWARRQTLLEDAAAGRFAALPAEPAGAGVDVEPHPRNDKCWIHHDADCERCPRFWIRSESWTRFGITKADAALAATPVGELDVERLARALKRVGHFTLDGKIGRCRPYADLIAAAYEGEK